MKGPGLLLRRGSDTLLACAAMLIVALLLGLFEYLQLDHRQQEALRTQAELVGRTTAAALLFDDAAEARALLTAFEAAPAVASARLMRRDGHALAEFRRDAAPDWLERHGGSLVTEVTVSGDKGPVVGRLRVWAFRAPTWRGLASVMLAAVLIMALALSVVALASRRQRARVRAADARTLYLAHHDVLTGLANRERFTTALAQVAASGTPAALM